MKRIHQHIGGFYVRASALMTLVLTGFLFAAPATASPCTTNCLTPGDYSLSLTSGGTDREYLLHVPSSYDGSTPVTLLIDAHGSGETSSSQRDRSGQLEQSNKRGFIVAWPQGVLNSWNAYGCCSVANATNVDDVGFMRSIIETLKARANVDKHRVYFTGWSNGGGLAQRMACEAADIVEAVAAISYPLNGPEQCHPSRPISLTEFAGTADALVPYYGSPLFQPARASFADWKEKNGCTDNLTRKQLNGGSRDETYEVCKGGVRTGLVTIFLGQHNLYDEKDPVKNAANGHGISGIDVAEYIWENVFK